jgi:phospholipid transport system transporter-binding protein
MISRDGQRLRVDGSMRINDAKALVDAGVAELPEGEAIVDLSGVEAADSSALAVIFAWARAQQARGGSLRIEGAPKGVRELADMYGVTELISIA